MKLLNHPPSYLTVCETIFFSQSFRKTTSDLSTEEIDFFLKIVKL